MYPCFSLLALNGLTAVHCGSRVHNQAQSSPEEQGHAAGSQRAADVINDDEAALVVEHQPKAGQEALHGAKVWEQRLMQYRMPGFRIMVFQWERIDLSPPY